MTVACLHTLNLGFVALTDCAPLVVAHRLGLDHEMGLQFCLQRQPSWSAVRDKLISGQLDAAHALYGLVYGMQLGMGNPPCDMAILMTLNQNGQGISLAPALADAYRQGASLCSAGNWAARWHWRIPFPPARTPCGCITGWRPRACIPCAMPAAW
jgi:nitrate/nitrite transport system substrate-binding protein